MTCGAVPTRLVNSVIFPAGSNHTSWIQAPFAFGSLVVCVVASCATTELVACCPLTDSSLGCCTDCFNLGEPRLSVSSALTRLLKAWAPFSGGGVGCSVDCASTTALQA